MILRAVHRSPGIYHTAVRKMSINTAYLCSVLRNVKQEIALTIKKALRKLLKVFIFIAIMLHYKVIYILVLFTTYGINHFLPEFN